MGRSIVFGYIESFAGVSLVTDEIKPIECRLQSGQAARIITLANGLAYNMNETAMKSGAQVRYPVEQRLRIIIRSAGGGRARITTLLGNIDNKHGVQGALVIRSGGTGSTHTCQAVLDEIIEESDMDKSDNAGISYGTFTLVFQQLSEWN